MKLTLVAINAKYIHSNLAVRYLKQLAQSIDWQVELVECSINDHENNVIAKIIETMPDMVAFSTYIWNIDFVLKIASSVKSILPINKIVLGGPEVSYKAHSLLKQHHFIDYIMCGEGEETIVPLLLAIENNEKATVAGLVYRCEEEIDGDDNYVLVDNLMTLPFPYIEGTETMQNKIIYYESSRGCPFSCGYCLSSATHGVRYLDIERVEKELEFFVAYKVKQVKFVDRTFNSDVARAKKILKIIASFDTKTNFHFEVCADLLDSETIDLLNQMPAGRVQIEAGIQTVNNQVLDSISRNNNHERIRENLKQLNQDNVHIHLDLIAGLPNETIESFERAYNYVESLKPDLLQLGFLKVLSGSRVEKEAEQAGLVWNKFAPYEILYTDTMSYSQIAHLKRLEEVHELYVNTHRFQYTLEWLNDQVGKGLFRVLWDFTNYLKNQNFFESMHGLQKQFDFLNDYIETILDKTLQDIAMDVLKYDYILMAKPTKYPSALNSVPKVNQQELYQKYKDLSEEYNQSYGSRMTAKKISKQTHLEKFKYNIDEIVKGKQVQTKSTWIWFVYKPKKKTIAVPIVKD